MKLAGVSLLALLLASPAIADLTPGFVVGSGAPFPIVADFNGDGLDDLIQEHNVVLNHGGALSEVRALPFADGEKVVGVLDVNGDGVLDLVTEGSQVAVPSSLPQPPARAPGYRLYIGDASRNYSKAIGISSGAHPYVADVDADGKDDFVIMTVVRANGIDTATDVTVLRSRGDGAFDQLETFRMPYGPQIYPDYRLLTGDVNHDGLPDLVIRCVQDLVVLRGTGGGKFAVETRHLPNSPNFGTQSARLADIDGDSNLDVILPAMRGIRVFFGDGRGNFPRTTRASIAKLRDIDLPEILVPKNAMEPRDLAIGHFTRTDRMQIAAGTMEGDLVVFSFEQGALREVSRTRTEFWHIDVRSGAFRSGGLDDVYAVGTLIWGENLPRPRLFQGQLDAIATTSVPVASRRRSARSGSDDVVLEARMHGDCVDETAARWTFTRDGIFGLAKSGATTVEAVFDARSIYFRLSAPFALDPAIGVLTEENGLYSGTTQMLTPCGYQTITVTANVE